MFLPCRAPCTRNCHLRQLDRHSSLLFSPYHLCLLPPLAQGQNGALRSTSYVPVQYMQTNINVALTVPTAVASPSPSLLILFIKRPYYLSSLPLFLVSVFRIRRYSRHEINIQHALRSPLFPGCPAVRHGHHVYPRLPSSSRAPSPVPNR